MRRVSIDFTSERSRELKHDRPRLVLVFINTSCMYIHRQQPRKHAIPFLNGPRSGLVIECHLDDERVKLQVPSKATEFLRMLRSILLKRCYLATTTRSLQRSTAPIISSPIHASPGPSRRPFRYSSSAAAFKVDTPIEISSHNNSATPPTHPNIRTAKSIRDRLPVWLRPYQVGVIESCVNALERGLQRIGVSSPTGSGKTVML
jgi:hypothetical protein